MIRHLDAFGNRIFDIVILGGGITGAGLALDAVLRGYSVALLDKGDFASGTTSASSKLIHGGLRYLEHGDVYLVYEALAERRRLLQNAPHLVRPLRFLLPFYKGQRRPPWQWRLGLTAYDLLAGRGNLRRSRPLTRSQMRRDLPALRSDGLDGGTEYYDAQMDDSRLCIEVIQTAVREGAVAANYLEAIGFEGRGKIDAVQAFDHVAGGELAIRGRQFVNAAGPWVDALCRLAGEDPEQKLQPTKGVHVILPGSPASGLLLLHPRDGRVFFVLPWMGRTLVGTTDTFAGCPDKVEVDAADIEYLLEGYNHFHRDFREVNDIQGSFAGLRPLIRARPGQPSALSREFEVFRGPTGLLSIAGGKYTTYRRMAEVAVDLIGAQLGRKRWCKTRDYPLDGTPEEPWDEFLASAVTGLCQRFGLQEATARHLASRYGRRAEVVAGYLSETPHMGDAICDGEPDIQAELAYQRDYEMAMTAEDFFLRRTRLGLYRPEVLTTASGAASARR